MSYATVTVTGTVLPLCGGDSVAYARGVTDRLEDSALMLRYRDGDVAGFEM